MRAASRSSPPLAGGRAGACRIASVIRGALRGAGRQQRRASHAALLPDALADAIAVAGTGADAVLRMEPAAAAGAGAGGFSPAEAAELFFGAQATQDAVAASKQLATRLKNMSPRQMMRRRARPIDNSWYRHWSNVL